MEILLIKLFIAHILGDFFLQFDSWVKEKEQKKLRSPKLYLHILLHLILILLIVWDETFFVKAICLALIHGLIDVVKLFLQRDKTRRLWFFIDQTLHIASILIIRYWASPISINTAFLNEIHFWIKLAAVLTLTFPTSIIIKVLIAKWTPQAIKPSQQEGESSLQSAGKYIGILER
ncbi:MAG TPA: DUF3307 domain-containing protein, partial [Pedobacter sp.]